MGWWIALGVLVLLAALPLGVRARYDEAGACLQVVIGPIAWKVYPRRKKKKASVKEKTVTSGSTETAKSAEASSGIKKKSRQVHDSACDPEKTENVSKEKGGDLRDFLPLLHLVLDFLGAVRRKLRVKRLYASIVMAGDDPCDLAINYGRANGALCAFMPQLERLFVIQKKDVQIACDFHTDKTLVTVDVKMTITLGRSIVLLIRYGVRMIREFMKLKKLRKGGTNHEPVIT